MPISPRAALGLAGVAGLFLATAAPAFGQAADESVKKTNTTAPAAAPKVINPAVVGTIDMDQVLKKYDKAKVMDDKLKAEVLVEQQKLTKMIDDGKALNDSLQRLKPGTPDHQKIVDELTTLKISLESGKERAQAQMEQRVSEAMTSILEDIKKVTGMVANKYSMAYVLRISKAPVGGTDQRSVGMSMAEPVVYSDPKADISDEVVLYLNHYYKLSGGAAPASTVAAVGKPAAPAPASNPAPATATGNGSSKTK